MTTTVIFIHSAGSQGKNQGSSNLITYLKEELTDKVNFVFSKMPTPGHPKYLEWKERIEETLINQTGKIILIGHSLGGSVLLKFLSEESYSIKIAGLFIVATPFWGLDQDWQGKDFKLHDQFEQQLKNIPNLFLYHSRNDEIVPYSHYKAYAEKLPQGIRRELYEKEHLFQNGLPELISDIETILKNK